MLGRFIRYASSSMKNLTEIDPTDHTLKDLVNENLKLHHSSYANCKFLNCQFSGVDFTASDFTDCVFDHCEINLPILNNVGLKSASFKNCKLIGVDFSRCNASFLNLSFEDCLIDTCNFSGLKLKATPFPRCIIRETRFVESFLEEACFDGSDMEDTVFHQCNLQKASFVNARNYWIDPTTNKLKGATFSLPEAISLLAGLGIKLL